MLRVIGIVTAFVCLAVWSSCQKEIASVIDTPLDNDTITTSESYIPLTESTFWVYQDSATNRLDTATVLGEVLVHDNINYKKVRVVSDGQEDYSYYGIKDHNYYLYGEESGITATMLVLNDLAEVGSSWVYDMGMINNLPARGTGIVVEKNITYTVAGKTYQNVIHTRYVIAYNILNSYVDVATYEFYFAQGIGIIKVQSSVTDGANSMQVATRNLVDYTVK